MPHIDWKSVFDCLGLGFLLVWGIIMRARNRQTRVAKIQAQKAKYEAQLEPTKAAIAERTQEINIADQERLEAEAKLRASLNRGNPTGPDCKSR